MVIGRKLGCGMSAAEKPRHDENWSDTNRRVKFPTDQQVYERACFKTSGRKSTKLQADLDLAKLKGPSAS